MGDRFLRLGSLPKKKNMAKLIERNESEVKSEGKLIDLDWKLPNSSFNGSRLDDPVFIASFLMKGNEDN